SALSPCHHLAERETFHQREIPDDSKLIQTTYISPPWAARRQANNAAIKHRFLARSPKRRQRLGRRHRPSIRRRDCARTSRAPWEFPREINDEQRGNSARRAANARPVQSVHPMSGPTPHPSTKGPPYKRAATKGPPASARWRRRAGTFTNILPAAAATSPRF